MVIGEKTRFFIPSKLAYGNQSVGSIKGGSTLIFDVELIAIKHSNPFLLVTIFIN
jgi:peptidylprolyl isomerase